MKLANIIKSKVQDAIENIDLNSYLEDALDNLDVSGIVEQVFEEKIEAFDFEDYLANIIRDTIEDEIDIEEIIFENL